MKTCNKCGTSKPITDYYKHPTGKDGYASICKPCKAEYESSRYDSQARRERTLKEGYGMSLDEYDALLADQGHSCAICGTGDPGHNSGRFVVDHDHTTGDVRGLLCCSCNLMLGKAYDNVSILKSAINYLNG